MNIKKLMMIPQQENIKEYIALAKEYGCGFEYNDFFNPTLLDNPEELEERLCFYQQPEHKTAFSTLHGAFLDITIFSDDSKIRQVSEYRVNQSLEIAKRLGAGGVVFHTNYLPNFLLDTYRDNWVTKNAGFWSKKLQEYPMLSIYIENMFDTDPQLLARLGEAMKEHTNFGICFDYAHAQVFGDEKELENWVVSLAPYVKHIHINDNDFTKDLHLAVGNGKINWQEFKRYYTTYFPEASVLLEVTGLEKTKQSLAYIRQL